MPKTYLGKPYKFAVRLHSRGFTATAYCETGPEDFRTHVVCAQMTTAFLDYSKSNGNDLVTPVPDLGFPGLTPGDRWCLCVTRWKEALAAGVAPRVVLTATHEAVLRVVHIGDLKKHALDLC